MEKNKITKGLFLAFSLALTFVCAESVSAQDTFNYSCDGADLRADYSPGKVRIRYGTQDFTLKQVQSGSGANYEGNDVKFSTRGKEAMLESPVLSATCKEKGSRPSNSSGGGSNTSSGGSTGDTVSYLCSQQTGVNVTFMDNGDRVRFEMDGNSGVLRRVRSGSGSKYTGRGKSGTVTFWTQGKEATLTTPDYNGKCTEQQ